ncbi:hypothetical protein AGMMS49975_01260 [Clostridia bacterium]|nr:hypothetical protein AGMMS49975_01260 [Clostridia bacterium]
MDLKSIFQIVVIAIFIAVMNQMLKRLGHEDQGTLVSIAGIIVVFMWLFPHISDLFTTIQTLFQI